MTGNSFSRVIKKVVVISIISTLLSLYFPSSNEVAKAFDLSSFSVTKKNQFFIGPGVTHSSYSMKSTNNIEAVNTLEVDPKNPYIKLEVTSPKDKVLALDTVRNQAKQIDRSGHRVIAAFNSDYFKTASPFAGQPIGLQITKGEIITAPTTSKSVLSIGRSGEAAISDQVKMTSKLEISGVNTYKSLTGVNRSRNKETQKNSLILFTSKFSTSTKTSGDELEILLDPNKATLTADTAILATVEKIMDSDNSSIPVGKWVLAATGTQAEWLKENITTGNQIQLKINFNKGLDGSSYAVSGGDMLIKNGEPTPTALKDNAERHPRTIIAANQGKLYITTFDGRQPGYSDGVTLGEAANYFSKKGMDSAINMDGGGSTTYAARLPGDQSLSILNQPSDGYERKVSNSLMIVSTAPVSSLAKITSIKGDNIKVLANTKLAIPLKGQDKYYNGVPVDAKNLTWTSSSAIGKVDKSGVFTAGSKPGKGKVTVQSGKVSKSISVEVVNSLKSLSITPKNAVITPGSKQSFKVKGYDNNGKEVYLTPGLLKWEVQGKIGKLDSTGTLVSSKSITNGKLIVSYGKTKVEATVNVGKPPVVIEDFEDIKDLQVTSARASKVFGTLTSRPNPVRLGTHAYGLSYDFTNTTGTSAAYINFKDKKGSNGRLLDSRPSKLGIWVNGDGQKHWLRASLQDGKGKMFTIDFTSPGKLNWEGWKHLYATIPSNTPAPIKVRQIYVVETSSTNKNKGTVYFDQFRAIYTEINEDVEGPVLSKFSPSNGKIIASGNPVISATITDKGKGVNPGSIILKVDGASVSFKYSSSDGVISYKPSRALSQGQHTVEIEATDKAGNPVLKNVLKFTIVS